MAEADMVDLISCLGSKESRRFDSGMMVEKKGDLQAFKKISFSCFFECKISF